MFIAALLSSLYVYYKLNSDIIRRPYQGLLNNISLTNFTCNTSNISTLKSGISLWLERWFLSSNAKDIGVLYLIFALVSGLIGTAFSVLIRLELSGPGIQFIADNQLYNSIITAHAIVMIFFMVDRKIVFNRNFHYSNKPNNVVITNEGSSNNNNSNNNKVPKYTKIEIENPFNNRKHILKLAKNQKGIYVWKDNEHAYVGHSINLYNRVSSYFMPSILSTKARRVLRYFNKHGFENVSLTLYITEESSSLEEIVRLEQYFIDTLEPSLNVDLVASSSGYHEPMNDQAKSKLRKERGTPIYVYDKENFTLLFVFESKQQMYDSVNIHHKTLTNCLETGAIYLEYFFFSLDTIEESEKTSLLKLSEIKQLIADRKSIYIIKHPSSKSILAEFDGDCAKNLVFSSLNSLANHLKGDRSTIREYLKGNKLGLYRGKWKLSYKQPQPKD